MRRITEFAPGKLNLTLDVLRKRPDGYHDMQMIMQTVSLGDTVEVTVDDGGLWRCECSVGSLPQNENNLAWKAAEAFFAAGCERPEHLRIRLDKHIPAQGGMAGGSADAAAVLRALNRLYGVPFSVEQLRDIGSRVGSDVPFCLLGGTALAEGRGEILTPLSPLPDCSFVLVKPEFSASTPALFSQLDRAGITERPDTAAACAALERHDLNGLCACVNNVFQPVLAAEYPQIQSICEKLREWGALAAALTGTGSVVFGVFSSDEIALQAAARMERAGETVFVAEPV